MFNNGGNLNLQNIKTQIHTSEQKFNREPNSVTLVAVTKGQSVETIKIAIAAGQKHFGESYVQEALPKIAALKDFDLVWHFIGPVQANKTKAIAENFAWVHSVDRSKIAERLNGQRPQNLPPLNVCLEVNVSDEASKSGVKFTDLTLLATKIIGLPRLQLRGLMAIPEHTTDFIKQRANFHKIALAQQDLIANGFKLDTLSMGMSDDFEAAIAEGATIVRIGSALFQ
jgi:pyridoxal phosphate enzyme (YggS family)